MASVRIYRFGSNPRKSGYFRVSKSTALKWWSWGTHVYLSQRAMIERYPNPLRPRGGQPPPPALQYSPHDLPPVELPHLHFEEPRSAAWREAHRKVIFPPRAEST